MYNLLRRFLFLFDAEKVHYFSMNILRLGLSIPGIKTLIRKQFSPADLPVSVLGLTFKNPVILAAGFDKNASYLDELETLGFGAVEIGTVTPIAQEGNPKPRLFRLPKDQAVINRMGFNNEGVNTIADRLEKRKNRVSKTSKALPMLIGGNIGKNKNTPNEDAWKDYLICFKALHPFVDYFVVNVSSPNTPGLRELQEKDSLKNILVRLQEYNATCDVPKLLLLKIAPDLTYSQINDVIDLALEIKLDGLVATNTTIDKTNLVDQSIADNIGAGGLSGAPLKNRSTEIVKYIAQKTGNKLLIIASGGIFTGADAKEKLDAGASLIQVWTGFIYKGPAIIKNISNYLAARADNTA